MTGFVIVNKAEGASSAKEVGIIKRLTDTPCGHLGTLDPMASGVLPVAIGNAARLFDYFLTKRKKYIADFKFGYDSDTLDTTGKVVFMSHRVLCKHKIEAVLPQLIGEIEQTPPKYSAKNVSGKRGYELARAGIEFELKPKKVNIYSIKLLNKTDENSFSFEIECGGGTYIRSIARDLGALLNTSAIMSSLVRTKSGIFELKNAVKTCNLTKENIQNFVIATDSVLPFDSFYPTNMQAKKLFNGLTADCGLSDGTYKIYCTDGSFYGLADSKDNILKVRTKLC